MNDEYNCAQILPVSERDSRGRFAAGNRAAIGHGTRSRDNLFTFRDCVTDDDVRELAAVLLAKARAGDITAIKLLLTYCLPQPTILFSIEEKRRRQEEDCSRYGYE